MKFHLGDILSITTGKLVSPRLMDGIYEILNYMTGDNLFTHQLPRAMRECGPELKKQIPELANITGDEVDGENWREWLSQQVKEHGEFFAVSPMESGKHEFKDPISEMVEMTEGKKPIIVVATS